MGETADPETLQEVTRLTIQHPPVLKASAPLSMYMGPEEVTLVLPVTFHDEVTSLEITRAIGDIRDTIQQCLPHIKQLFIEPRVNPD